MKVYLAGPDVFLPDAADIGRRKKEICARFGLVGLFPLDSEITADGRVLASHRIYRGNTDMMMEAEAIIANLTPFRGPSADPGTIYELGFMAGRGKLCLGYSNRTGAYYDRVAAFAELRAPDGQNPFFPAGCHVENFGLADNLMVVHSLEENGHPLVIHDVPEDERLHDLTAFETCVRQIEEQRRSDEARARQRVR